MELIIGISAVYLSLLVMVINHYVAKTKRLEKCLQAEVNKCKRLRAAFGYPGQVVFSQDDRPLYGIPGDLWVDNLGVTRRMIDEDGMLPGGEWARVDATAVKGTPATL